MDIVNKEFFRVFFRYTRVFIQFLRKRFSSERGMLLLESVLKKGEKFEQRQKIVSFFFFYFFLSIF